MREESAENSRPLRSGLTTGACATATALAAAHLLLLQQKLQTVTITLPKGQQVEFTINDCLVLTEGSAQASTVKDAGDDPDVTHGATITSKIVLSENPGVKFFAGSGVGTVTRDGLPISKGEPAINPVPRRMISEHLQQLAERCGYKQGFEVYISVENGEALAQKTMNPRLGIIGGLSILGTTGIVRPFSCAAYIASIQQGIDVAYVNGVRHIAACTGSSSEQHVQQALQLPEIALIEMGDFVGAVLKHLKKVPMQRLTICGGFGKVSKLAAGHKDLHSRSSSIDLAFLAGQAKLLGCDENLQHAIQQSNTSIEALTFCPPLGHHICLLAQRVAQISVPADCVVDVIAINRQGEPIGEALGASA